MVTTSAHPLVLLMQQTCRVVLRHSRFQMTIPRETATEAILSQEAEAKASETEVPWVKPLLLSLEEQQAAVDVESGEALRLTEVAVVKATADSLHRSLRSPHSMTSAAHRADQEAEAALCNASVRQQEAVAAVDNAAQSGRRCSRQPTGPRNFQSSAAVVWEAEEADRQSEAPAVGDAEEQKYATSQQHQEAAAADDAEAPTAWAKQVAHRSRAQEVRAAVCVAQKKKRHRQREAGAAVGVAREHLTVSLRGVRQEVSEGLWELER